MSLLESCLFLDSPTLSSLCLSVSPSLHPSVSPSPSLRLSASLSLSLSLSPPPSTQNRLELVQERIEDAEHSAGYSRDRMHQEMVVRQSVDLQLSNAVIEKDKRIKSLEKELITTGSYVQTLLRRIASLELDETYAVSEGKVSGRGGQGQEQGPASQADDDDSALRSRLFAQQKHSVLERMRAPSNLRVPGLGGSSADVSRVRKDQDQSDEDGEMVCRFPSVLSPSPPPPPPPPPSSNSSDTI